MKNLNTIIREALEENTVEVLIPENTVVFHGKDGNDAVVFEDGTFSVVAM